jgi:molybdate transport system ATP-binding protein
MINARLIKRFSPGRESAAFELNVHLEAPAGITVLFGPSGAGKSLTLNCIAGFAKPDEGRVLVNDEIYFDAASGVDIPPQRRRCGYIFQDQALFPHMTVRENLLFAASVADHTRLSGLQRRRRVNELLENFQLSDLAARKPAQLSGGQKQRAALARTLVADPRILLLDEPARGLDRPLREAFYQVLKDTRQRLKVPILLVTHDVEECLELADFICLIADGRFLQCGARNQVLEHPASVEAARTLGIFNILPAEITALDPGRNYSKLKVFDQHIEGPYLPGHLLGDHGFICIRESETFVIPNRSKESSNAIELRLLAAEPSARGMRLRLQHDVSVTLPATDYESIRGQTHVRIEIPAAAVWFVPR